MADKPKRTRTKKTIAAPVAEAPVASLPSEPAATATAPEKKKGKKEKKPIQVVAIVTPDGIEGTFTPEPRRPLIVHLPFKSSEVQFNATSFAGTGYDPRPPPNIVPYDNEKAKYFQVNSDGSSSEVQVGVEQEGWTMPGGKQQPSNTVEGQSSTILPYDNEQEKYFQVNSNGSSSETQIGVEQEGWTLAGSSTSVANNNSVGEQKTKEISSSNYMKEENFKRIQLLACYASAQPGSPFTPPTKTDVKCFWCSQNFENMPCFLPVKEESGVYHIYGNFCTPQCGLAYLLNEHLDSHVRWERMALLHRMYHPTGKIGGRLYPAPPRECLVDFGGTYMYDQYRKVISDGKVRVDIQVPPMISILGTLDTKPIDFYDSSLQNTLTGGFSLDRFKSWSEQGGALRLKRSKPLKDKESTLDACIQISVKRHVGAVA
jgi:hypothetical protein